MKPEFDPQLEKLIDAELKQLPPPAAPSSLLPNVMSVIAARERLPWWQRAWWDWPLTAKTAFLLLAVAIAGVFSGGGVMLDQGVSTYSQQVVERYEPVSALWNALQVLAGIVTSQTDKLGQSFLIYAAVFAGLLYLMCVGLGTVCVRYAMKRA